MNYPRLNKNTRYQEFIIRSRYPEFHKYILQNYPDQLKWTEKLYWFYNNLQKAPICKTCGKPVAFLNIYDGYRTYCSNKCCANDPNWIDNKNQTCLERHGNIGYRNLNKIKQTCLERYGVENPMKLKEVRDKSKQTCLERYGVENPSQSQKIINKIKQTKHLKYGCDNYNNHEQTIKTCLERYGVENPSQLEDVKEKKRKTSILNYGTPYPMQSIELSERIHDKNNKKFYEENPDIINIYKEPGSIYKTFECKCPDPTCNLCEQKTYIIQSHTYRIRKYNNLDLCTTRYQLNNTTSIETFIEKILRKNNISYTKKNRTIISPYELDIYIPLKNIAIECNGCYWHSTEMKEKTYHINKYKKCEEKSIQLISIWEDWVHNFPHIVESLILSKLGIYENRIYARKCIVKEINSKVCNNFLNQNHIQGKSNSSIKLGLYNNNELVSVMTFNYANKLLKKHDNNWNLSRFCSKLNTQVVGAAGKLLKYFIKKYNPSQIISFASNDISNGSLYKKLGFIQDSNISLAYWYIHKQTFKRYHRTSFEKKKLKSMGFDTDNYTEFQIMSKLPYFRIYDSGHVRYDLILKKS